MKIQNIFFSFFIFLIDTGMISKHNNIKLIKAVENFNFERNLFSNCYVYIKILFLNCYI